LAFIHFDRLCRDCAQIEHAARITFFAAIARAAGLSRERVRQLYGGN
jgi:hypothetical protein